MKLFDIHKWRRDKTCPVFTQDGRRVLQLTEFDSPERYPLYGMIEGGEDVESWTVDGIYDITDVYKSKYNLVLGAVTKKKIVSKVALDSLKDFTGESLACKAPEFVEITWEE